MAIDEQPFAEIEHALKRAAAALNQADVPFLLGGSLASWAAEARRRATISI